MKVIDNCGNIIDVNELVGSLLVILGQAKWYDDKMLRTDQKPKKAKKKIRTK